MSSLDGQVAIITGGGTGIGRGIALAFAAEGMRVVISGRRKAPLDDTLAVIEQNGGQGLVVQGDVSNEHDVAQLVQAAVEAYGTVDVLVNNAAISGVGGALHEYDIEDWDRVMAINLRGPFLLSRAVLPMMRQRGSGHVVMISSESGLEYYPNDLAYGVSKHALNAMSELMQRENQDQGIHVHVVCPGMVITEMTQHSPIDHAKSLTPEDIADLVLWLVSRRQNVKIGRPVLIQTMENPWT